MRTDSPLPTDDSSLMRQMVNLVLSPLPLLIVLMAVLIGSLGNADAYGSATAALLPAGFAFLIWLPIDIGLVAYGIYQAQSRQRDNRLLAQIGWPMALSLLAASFWTAALLINVLWLSMLLLVWIGGALVWTYVRMMATPRPFTAGELWFVMGPISTFLGWVVVSMPVNVTMGLAELGVSEQLLGSRAWSLVLLTAAITAATWLAGQRDGNLFLALTAVWGLSAIGFTNLAEEGDRLLAVWAGVGAITVALAALVRRVSTPSASQRPVAP